MRWIAVLLLAAVMYVSVPYLWQRAMVAKVKEISADRANFPEMNSMVATNLAFDQNVINAINPTVTINTDEYEAIAVQSRADQVMRQSQAAQDQAWRATH